MAGIKISDLPDAPSATLTDVFPIDQGAVTYKETNQQTLTLFKANGETLTKTDDTNVTMSLGGSPTNALLNATSMTLGWTGSLAVGRGGTGNTTFTPYSVICAGTTLTGTFQNVSGVGTSNQVLTSNGASALPTWQAVPAPTGAALTKVDDTNVTLTLGGTPATALLQATSITAGWTGQLGLTRGGTAASLVASTGGIVYSGASALAILSGTATANLPLLSGSSAAPTWGSFALSLGGVLTTAGAHTLSGAFASTFTFTNTTTVTFPTSGTLATTSQIPTGAALTKTDDTNVTLTLGGSPTTALVNAASITVGWTGQLAANRGGTGISSLGTGVATALGVNVGSAGAFVTNGGALGTPASGNLSNCTFATGNWTPALTGSSAGPGAITYAFQSGQYTKIGNVVYYFCRIIVSALTIGAASGQLQITGLPFTVADNLSFDPLGTALLQNVSIDAGSIYIAGRATHGQTYLNILEGQATSSNAVALAITNISSSSDISVTGFYFT